MLSLKSAVACGVMVLAGSAFAQTPITLKAMGSFHIGGREITLSGKPVKEVQFTPGGVPAKVVKDSGARVD